jgi:acetyl-CoA acetyltransferase
MKKEKGKSRLFITEEQASLVDEMKESEMNDLLLSISDSRTWIAILKYSLARLDEADDALHTLDPFVEPTKLARHQGIISGISDLAEMVYLLNEKKKNPINLSEEN